MITNKMKIISYYKHNIIIIAKTEYMRVTLSKRMVVTSVIYDVQKLIGMNTVMYMYNCLKERSISP